MAGPLTDSDSGFGGGARLPAFDPGDPLSSWDFNWMNPFGEYIGSLPEQMLGSLSLQRINGPREFYTDPQAYFAMRPANDAAPDASDASPNWAKAIGGADTVSGSDEYRRMIRSFTHMVSREAFTVSITSC